MYLQNRMRWRKCWLLRPVIQILVFIIAYYTSISRISDYMHHWSDVLGGSVLGISVAILVVSFNEMRAFICSPVFNVTEDLTSIPWRVMSRFKLHYLVYNKPIKIWAHPFLQLIKSKSSTWRIKLGSGWRFYI